MRSDRCAVQNQGITLKLVKATEKGKKLKQGLKGHTWDSLRALTQKAAHLLMVPIDKIIHCFTQL